MQERRPTSVWEFDESLGFDPATAIDRLAPPSWEGILTATHGDVVCIQLNAGVRHSLAPTARFYIERRGPYRLLRREPWADGRVLLTMRAWPQRGLDDSAT